MKNILLSIILLLMISCNHVYKEYDKKSFEGIVWKPGKELIFRPTIDEAGKTYQLKVGLRHVYGLQLDQIGVKIFITYPSGKSGTQNYTLRIKDDSGQYTSRCAGDLCDLEQAVDKVLLDETGTYTITMSHTFSNAAIPGIMEAGLIIDEVE